MATKSISIVRDPNGYTLNVRVGTYKEAFDARYMGKDEIIDRVRWILVTCNVVPNDATIEQLLRENRVII